MWGAGGRASRVSVAEALQGDEAGRGHARHRELDGGGAGSGSPSVGLAQPPLPFTEERREPVAEELAEELPARARAHVRQARTAHARERVHLQDPELHVVRLDHQLGIEEPALRLELHALEDLAVDDLRGPVDVDRAQPRPEAEDEGVVGDGDHLAAGPVHPKAAPYLAQGVRPADLQRVEESNDVLGVHLPVRRDEADPLAAGVRDAGEETVPVALVDLDLGGDDREALRLQLEEDLGRSVRRAVVDADELQPVRGRREGLREEPQGVGQHLLLVVAGNDEREIGTAVGSRVRSGTHGALTPGGIPRGCGTSLRCARGPARR